MEVMIINYFMRTRSHWWFDAGLSGLFFIALEVKDNDEQYRNITVNCRIDGLEFIYEDEEQLKLFLKDCYEKLVARYWNVSTKKQKENLELVRWNKDLNKPEAIAKRNPTPIPAKFIGAKSWRAEGIDYEEMTSEKKILIDDYLNKNNKQLWGKKKKLVFEPPVCHYNIKIWPQRGNKTTCSLCGSEDICEDISLSSSSFPLYASKSATLSFHSEGRNPTDKICWGCQLLGAFAVESAHYKKTGDNLFVLQLASNNLNDLINTQQKITGGQGSVRELDENYFSNIGTNKQKNRILFYARLPYELLWAFFHDTYFLIKEAAASKNLAFDDEYDEIKSLVMSPMYIVLIHLLDKGQTFLTKNVIYYNDFAYVYRLLSEFKNAFPSDHDFLYKIFNDLYIKMKTDNASCLWRNRILEKVLNKKHITQDLEVFCYFKYIKADNYYGRNMLDFAIEYQLLMEGEDSMLKKHIEVAVNLGRQIGGVIKKEDDNKNDKRVKGDLYALRKTRTKSDFLEQLSRIQFRYNLNISNEIVNGMLDEERVSFADFKSYCLISALNTYSGIQSKKTDATDNVPEEVKEHE